MTYMLKHPLSDKAVMNGSIGSIVPAATCKLDTSRRLLHSSLGRSSISFVARSVRYKVKFHQTHLQMKTLFALDLWMPFLTLPTVFEASHPHGPLVISRNTNEAHLSCSCTDAMHVFESARRPSASGDKTTFSLFPSEQRRPNSDETR